MTEGKTIEIDAEAMPVEDWNLGEDLISVVNSGLHGSNWNNQAEVKPGVHQIVGNDSHISAELREHFSKWIGAKLVNAMKPNEMSVVINAIKKLGLPIHQESFVWAYVQDPSDVRPIREAIDLRSAFSTETASVSHIIGTANSFRDVIKGFDEERETTLNEMIERYTQSCRSLMTFYESLGNVSKAFSALYDVDDMSVEATLVLLAASNGLSGAVPLVSSGFVLSRQPREDELELFDELRRKVVDASQRVHRLCFISPIECSLGVLAGVIRSLSGNCAGDFGFAVESLGGRMESKEQIIETSQAFVDYIMADRTFKLAVEKAGFEDEEIDALLAHILIRRHIISAASAFGVEWRDVDIYFRMKETLTYNEFVEVIGSLSSVNVSGRLESVSKDRQRKLADVQEVIKNSTTQKLAFLETAEKIKVAHPEVTIGQIQSIIDLEPGLREAEKGLNIYGVNSNATMKELQSHLKWMISVFGLPVPDEAVEMVVETKGRILPFHLLER